MLFLLVGSLLAAAATRTVPVDAGTRTIDVAVGESVRLVFPERATGLDLPELEVVRELGLRPEAEAPKTILRLEPRKAGLRARLAFSGAKSGVLELTVVTVGRAAKSAPPPFDFGGLVLARAITVAGRSGPLVLEDGLESPRWLWLRFRLPGAARLGDAESVAWGATPAAHASEAVGPDLRLVVQLPLPEARAENAQALEVRIQGATYKVESSLWRKPAAPLVAASPTGAPSSTPTPRLAAAPTALPTPRPTPTPTPKPTVVPTPRPTQTPQAPRATPTPVPKPSPSVAPTPRPSATPRAPQPRPSAAPTPSPTPTPQPPPRATSEVRPSPSPAATSSAAPTPSPSPLASPSPLVVPPVAATPAPAAGSSSAPGPGTQSGRHVWRINRRMGLPGQVPLNIESLALDGGVVELTVVAIGGARSVSAPELSIEGVTAQVAMRVEGKNLVLVGSVPKGPKRPRSARLSFVEGKGTRTENLKLQGPGLVDFVLGPGQDW